MNTVDEWIKKLPPETQQLIEAVWGNTPPDRRGLSALLGKLPNDTQLLRLLMEQSRAQLKLAFGGKHRVAIVGPANVGKSTLYNQFIQEKQDRAKVSPVAGTTRQNQQADAGLFAVIDTPGADAVGEVGEREREMALSAAADADFIIILFDAVQGVKQTELDLYRQLVALDKPYAVALNKIDLVRRDKLAVVAQVAQALGLQPEQVIPISARGGENLKELVLAVALAEPALISAMGQAMPQFRWQLAWRAIVSSASISAAVALTPLPVIDFAPLIVNQSVMVLGIARIYSYEITLQRARELAVTFGLGLIGRTLFAQLSKLAGVPGWLLSAAIAASTTVVMGVAAAQWFERGERMSSERLNQLTRQLTRSMLSSLRGLGKRRPGREALRRQVEKTLAEVDIHSLPPEEE